jgi:hypothetical protein
MKIRAIFSQIMALGREVFEKMKKNKEKNNFFKEIILKSKENNKKIKEFFCV